MSKRREGAATGAMLDLWRPPQRPGDPVGCLATTYTFAPGLFDEQCLARFLEIESEPNREDLAFLVERESRLGGVYAGVLVDHTQAGVEHSLRWDVLPVRIRASKQHAKLSVLAWSRHVRIIVASANLTEQGYRSNYEVAGAINLTPDNASIDRLTEASAFLRSLLAWVPASGVLPAVGRAKAFLDRVEKQVAKWQVTGRGAVVRQQLVFTLPETGGREEQSSLEDAFKACRGRGGAPSTVRVASPFFDADDPVSRVTGALCKLMARGRDRKVHLCIPAVRGVELEGALRLAAPKALLKTALKYAEGVKVDALPEKDREGNHRIWHAKMVALSTDQYSALMIGSSNFTCFGLGVGERRHAEANLVTIVDRVDYGREAGQLQDVWPDTLPIEDPDSAEWLGARPDEDEEDPTQPPAPSGFLSVTYRAGSERHILLRLDPPNLPGEWSVHTCGRDDHELLNTAGWRETGRLAVVSLHWQPVQPPEKILVRWEGHEAFLPLNVEDGRELPPPPQFEHMTADDMLFILAASDPSAAFRVWAKRQQSLDSFDSDLDSATPIDLDPLRRHDLQATFLHRIRRRAGVLAQLRANLERPVWGQQALEWRLRGLIGLQALADRLVREVGKANGATNEALLTLADFLIVLREVEYQPQDGSLSKGDFHKVYRPFLKDLADKLGLQVDTHRERIGDNLLQFWARVVQRCRA